MSGMLKSKRLILRPVGPEDAAAIHAYAGDPKLDMMMFFPHETPEDTQRFVEYAVSQWETEEPEDREYVILLDGEIIGGANLEACPDGGYEIGWIIRRDHRGNGYAAESAQALFEYAFDVLRADRVQAHCDSRNAPSEHLMKKLGMTLLDASGTRYYPRTGIVSGEYLYAISKAQYRERKREP